MLSAEDARTLLCEHIEKTGKTQTQVAKELGISDGQLSSFKSGTYKAAYTVIPKIEQLVSMAYKKEIAPREPGFKRTKISGIVMDLIAYCHVQGKVGVAYGDAGVGKTMGVMEYKRVNPDNTIIITVSPCFSSVAGVSDLIADELKIKDSVSRKIYLEAVRRLRGSNRVVVVDEAQHLTVKAIEYLRCMADESHVGMAFVGNEAIYSKMIGSGRSEYAQLYSRIAHRDPVQTRDISKGDIALIFEDSALDETSLEILLKISRTNYGLRGAVNVFVNTAAVFSEVDSKGLARMAKEMGIG